MRTYSLQTEFSDSTAEQALIASVAHNPTLYFELLDMLSPDVFTTEAQAWQHMALAIETEQQPELPDTWQPTATPHATARRLKDLYQRRLLAAAQERLAQALFDDQIAATTLATMLEEEALRVQAAMRESEAGQLRWASDLVPRVLEDAADRRRQRELTGKAILGVPSGIPSLDEALNGLNEGLYLLGGPPGVGKTTLALQIAAHVTRDIPVVFVTFENAPENLTLKALCAHAGVKQQDVQRGWADLKTLHAAALAWQPIAHRLALIEGSSRLTVSQVKAHALRAMKRHDASRCVVMVDYLQLWAKTAEDLRSVFQVRERVEVLGSALRELSLRLRSPVVALSSQNRAQGHYGNGKGSAALDSLKESGDLEYAADVVLFLTESTERQTRPPARAVNLTIAKNRHGDTGKVSLMFRPDLGTLREEAQV